MMHTFKRGSFWLIIYYSNIPAGFLPLTKYTDSELGLSSVMSTFPQRTIRSQQLPTDGQKSETLSQKYLLDFQQAIHHTPVAEPAQRSPSTKTYSSQKSRGAGNCFPLGKQNNHPNWDLLPVSVKTLMKVQGVTVLFSKEKL